MKVVALLQPELKVIFPRLKVKKIKMKVKNV